MVQRIFIISFLILISICANAQNKKMTPETYAIWNTLNQSKISPNGDWVAYTITPGTGDRTLVLYNTRTGNEERYERSHSAEFDYNNTFVSFKTSISYDSLQSLKLKKTKKDKLPKDTINIISLNAEFSDKVSSVERFSMPEKSGGLIAMTIKGKSMKKDSTLVKDENSENGLPLLVYDYNIDTFYNFDYVKDFMWAKTKNTLLINTTGNDSINHNQIGLFHFDTKDHQIIHTQKGEYFDLNINDDASMVSFLVDADTTKVKPRPYDLYLWKKGQKLAQSIADNGSSFIPEGWQISNHGSPIFSEKNDRLYFNIAPIPMMEDTTIVEEDKAVVEVWHYEDPLLYTMQNVRSKREKERIYRVLYNIETSRFIRLNDQGDSELRINAKNNAPYTLSYDERAYQKNISWKGYSYKDIYLTDVSNGSKRKIVTATDGTPNLSPHGKYAIWYAREDTSWVTYNIQQNKQTTITKGAFYNEEDDRPTFPSPSGPVEWIGEDDNILMYDHYDLWLTSPDGRGKPVRLTDGRENNVRYRLVRIDREVTHYPADTTLLLKSFNTKNKDSGYVYLNLKDRSVTKIETGPYNYTTRILKAEKSDDLIFTKEDFRTFPNLIHTQSDFKNQKIISDVNPQQSEYAWGDIQLVEWKDDKGLLKSGMLLTPDNFDSSKKYPMMVNFYEKSSDRLHSHRAPYPGRSTINYSYWVNKGYVIFNPDVDYIDGYPGQSAYNDVISGVENMISRGFVDADRIGVQGHSWGGYQIAHLITKTDIFKCAEAGAPVVNMVSAYGGIRWGSGMSRMFQYERTQSRLGATLWEKPDLYLENSPIFNIDKINTPVLILHNDNDGAVPWYQGIEFFVGMRRLGKPAWMLNYNGEPHWPVKKANRLDFNTRLEQFFDHYLMDAPMPEWMSKGIPAVEKGINYGFELEDKK